MKSLRDKKGRYRKQLDCLTEEVKTFKKIVNLFMPLQFKESRGWIILWLNSRFGNELPNWRNR